MLELNTLIVNKLTLNNGIVFFDDLKKMNSWLEVLKQNNVKFVKYIILHDNKRYYGVRMFRMKKQFFKLCVKFKEVMDI